MVTSYLLDTPLNVTKDFCSLKIDKTMTLQLIFSLTILVAECAAVWPFDAFDDPNPVPPKSGNLTTLDAPVVSEDTQGQGKSIQISP